MRNFFALFILLILSAVSIAQKTSADSCTIQLSSSLSLKLKDTLKLFCECPIEKFNIEIYNRWGQKVFESNVIQRPNYILWNYSKEKEGVYVWMIKYTAYFRGNYPIIKQKTGYVTLLVK